MCSYVLSTAVIGAAYTIFQIAFTISRMSTSNGSTSGAGALIDFFGDKVYTLPQVDYY